MPARKKRVARSMETGNAADWRALLESQFESAIDGILVVGPKGDVLAKNRQFGRLWGIPKNIIATNNDKLLLTNAVRQLADPDAFMSKVKRLYAHHNKNSFDRLTLKDGRIFDRYSAPFRDEKNVYLGRIWYFRDATEKLAAQKQAASNENIFQTIFNNAADPIYILDTRGRFLEANEAAWETLGYTHAQLLKLSVKDISSPKRMPSVANKIEKVSTAGSATFTSEHLTKKGKTIPVEINARTIFYKDRPAIIAVCRDLSVGRRLHALETQALADEKKFKTVFDNAGDAIFILPGANVYDKKFIDANQTACNKLGYGRNELLTMTPRDLEMPPAKSDFDQTLNERVERMRKQGLLFFQVEMRAKDGRMIPFELISRATKYNGQKVLVCIARDLTDIKRVRELQELKTLQDDFLNITTHELRTPLTSIIGLSEIISRDNNSLTPKEREYLNIIHEEGQRLARTIKQILEVTRYENRNIPVNKSSFKLDDLATSLKPILETIAAGQHAKISIAVSNGTQMIATDREKITQVVFDLVDNAVKFGPEEQTVAVAVSRPTEKEIMIAVTDQGPGIPENRQSEIFKKFGQLDTSLARSQEGIGLGLYTAKMIIEALGGKIGVKNGTGKGATFWFTLPV